MLRLLIIHMGIKKSDDDCHLQFVWNTTQDNYPGQKGSISKTVWVLCGRRKGEGIETKSWFHISMLIKSLTCTEKRSVIYHIHHIHLSTGLNDELSTGGRPVHSIWGNAQVNYIKQNHMASRLLTACGNRWTWWIFQENVIVLINIEFLNRFSVSIPSHYYLRWIWWIWWISNAFGKIRTTMLVKWIRNYLIYIRVYLFSSIQ